MTNTKIPHHKKIIQKLNYLFDSLHPKLKEANPIISGSYAINLLFKPTSPYKDIDFYFQTEEDFIKAADCFFDVGADRVTANKNCVIYEINGFQYQLITRSFSTPFELITDHDFYNSAIAIQNENIFLLKNLIPLYNDDLLEFQNIHFYNYETPEKQISGFNTFFNRILKYLNRYDFDLSEKAMKDLNNISIWLDKKIEDPAYNQITAKTNMYYNLTYSETNTQQISFCDLVSKFKFFIDSLNPAQSLEDLHESILF